MMFILAGIWFLVSRKLWSVGSRALPIGTASAGVFLAPLEFLTAFAVWLFFARVKIIE